MLNLFLFGETTGIFQATTTLTAQAHGRRNFFDGHATLQAVLELLTIDVFADT